MERTPDATIDGPFGALDTEAPRVPDSDGTSAASMAESFEKHKRHDRSKRHKKHKRRTRKSKRRKHRSRSGSPRGRVELKLEVDGLGGAEPGTPVAETTATAANEKSEGVGNREYDENENSDKDKMLTVESRAQTPEKDTNETSNTILRNTVTDNFKYNIIRVFFDFQNLALQG